MTRSIDTREAPLASSDAAISLPPAAHRLIDLTDLRRGAEVDLRGATAARRQACDMLKASIAVLVAAERHRQEAVRERAEALRVRAQALRARNDATVDDLTGALRRNAGFHALNREMARARRERKDLVIGFLDVDGLKKVNDTQGHQAGDDLLRTVVDTLRASLRSYDVVVRYGGDEFVFSIGGADVRAAERRVATMRCLLAESLPDRTVSAGFAQAHPGDDLDVIIRRADVDMLTRRARDRARQPPRA